MGEVPQIKSNQFKIKIKSLRKYIFLLMIKYIYLCMYSFYYIFNFVLSVGYFVQPTLIQTTDPKGKLISEVSLFSFRVDYYILKR